MISNRIFLHYNSFCSVFGILDLKVIFNKMERTDRYINLFQKAACSDNFQVPVPTDNLHIELKCVD